MHPLAMQGGVEQVQEHPVSMPPLFRGLSSNFLLDDLPLLAGVGGGLSPRGQASWSLSDFDLLMPGLRSHSYSAGLPWQPPSSAVNASRSPSVSKSIALETAFGKSDHCSI